MYRNEIDQLRIAINALDVLLEGTSNIYTSIDSIRLNNEPIKQSMEALQYSRQYLVAQVNILLKAQEELALITEQITYG